MTPPLNEGNTILNRVNNVPVWGDSNDLEKKVGKSSRVCMPGSRGNLRFRKGWITEGTQNV